MAATEASTEPVQGDTVDTKAEAEPTNVEIATAPAEEAQTTTEAPQSAEQPADSKAKPASEKIWDSFLNKSGLGKVMGGKKKKEQSTGAEDAVGDEQEKTATLNQPDQGEAVSPNDQATSESADTTEATTEGQAKEKAPDDEEEKKEPGAKPKQGEKSSVKDFIRKPVARIFSHRSTEKKDGTGEVRKHSKVRSKSLDRLQDADASTVVVDQIEDPQAADEPDKSASQTTERKKGRDQKK
ncbi:uncharacterized protein LOC115814279 [Chanos chanos]|uniref:Uncharacterized protein LOC115814279 n=1 Tax=Chanos chanos TaxID=29144 RepID=A0A6J2VIW6_CHACN|nr:uncharacterized protein LOC115814279 [Chanos chanos]